MPRHNQRYSLFALVSTLICLTLPVLAQNDRLNGEIASSFSRFDVVQLDAASLRSAPGTALTLRFNAVGRDITIALTPHDMRAPNSRAQNTGEKGDTSIERTPVNTFIGSVKGNTDAVSRINILGTKIEGYFSVDDQRYFIEPAANYSAAATTRDYVIYRLEDSKRTDTVSCGSHLVEKIENGKAMANPATFESPSTIKHVEIATDADVEYVNALGGVTQANNEILGVLNAIEGLYESQTSLAISVVFQHTWTTADPYAGVNTEITVRNFQAFWNANYPLSTTPRDTAHLFSGKPNVLSQGWAFIGVICNNPSFAYGVSGYISWEPGKFLLTAHELGHNLGGNHVDTGQNCGNTLMNPQISGSTPLTFCQYSTGEISTFVNTNGTCLTTLSACKLDFDGDSKADLSLFRPSTGAWYLLQSQAGFSGTLFGNSTDRMAPADFDGDGKTDIAVYRPSTGYWYVLNSSNGTVSFNLFGSAEDLPAPGDFDGDGRADLSVFRPSNGTWYRLNSSNGGFVANQFGATGDKPTIGDFDGDGKTDIALYRPSNGGWYRLNSSTGAFVGAFFGTSTDVIAPADFDGDGKTDLAVYRPSAGTWYIIDSSTQAFRYVTFGLAGDIPAAGDFDGDGKSDVSVFRPTDGTWYRLNSSTGAFVATQFGANGDRPTQSAFAN